MINFKNIPVDLSYLDHNYKLYLLRLFEAGIRLERVGSTSIIQATYRNQVRFLYDIFQQDTSFVSGWLVEDKYLTKLWLQNKGISVPKGKVLSFNQTNEAIDYALEVGFPVVAKPVNMGHGWGVYSEIKTQNQLRESIQGISKLRVDNFLLEKHIFGEEYRIVITGEGFYSVIHRQPASVIGDGKNSINDLIDKENFRRMNPRDTCLCTIIKDKVVNDFLMKDNLTLESIPKKNEQIFLRPNSNISCGGWAAVVTDQAHSSFKRLAIKILDSIPQLSFLGIDLICKNISLPIDKQSYAICELGSTPGLSLHDQPATGKSEELAKELAARFVNIIKNK